MRTTEIIPNPTYKGLEMKSALDTVKVHCMLCGQPHYVASVFKEFYRHYKIRLN